MSDNNDQGESIKLINDEENMLLRANDEVEMADNVATDPFLPQFTLECANEQKKDEFKLSTVDAFQTFADVIMMFLTYGIFAWKRYQTILHISSHRIICMKREYYSSMFYTTSYYIGMLKDVKFINIQADTRPFTLTYSIESPIRRRIAVFLLALPAFILWLGVYAGIWTLGIIPALAAFALVFAGLVVIVLVYMSNEKLLKGKQGTTCFCCPAIMSASLILASIAFAITGSVLGFTMPFTPASNGLCLVALVCYVLAIVSLPRYPKAFPSTLQIHFSDVSTQTTSTMSDNSSNSQTAIFLAISFVLTLVFIVGPYALLGPAMYIINFLTCPVSISDKFVFKNSNQVINAYLTHKDAEKAKQLIYSERKDKSASNLLA